jgi:ribosome-associated protein
MAIKKTTSSKPKAAKPKTGASAAKSKPKSTLSGPKKSPAKKAAIKSSSATVKKLEAKGRAASTGAKKKKATTAKVPREKKAPKEKKAPAAVMTNPEARKLAERAADLILDKKGDEVVVVDVCGRTGYTDYLVIASGETERQVSAIAEHVEVSLKGEGHRVISAEGHTPGQWVLLDYGDVIVHLFTGEARPFYDLEGMWPDAPRETRA